jgi:hypothetical protein
MARRNGRAAVIKAKHKAMIADKLREGWPQQRIAAWINEQGEGPISQPTVSRAVKELQGEWAREARADYYPRMWEMLEAARFAQEEARAAWEESKKPREVVRMRQVGDKTHTEAIREPGRPGAEYLGMLIKAMETEMKMLGVGTAQEHQGEVLVRVVHEDPDA